MLVLSRRTNEAVVAKMGDTVLTVRVVDIGRDRVRLGFEADTSIVIHREEIAAKYDWKEWAEKEPVKRPA